MPRGECLKCGRKFKSTSKDNWLCNQCRSITRHTSTVTAYGDGKDGGWKGDGSWMRGRVLLIKKGGKWVQI